VHNVPKWAIALAGLILRAALFADRRIYVLAGSVGDPDECIDSSLRMTIKKGDCYLCSKSTGAVTWCTRKYFASAGYFRATASYIA
jgi:hypothetical protein